MALAMESMGSVETSVLNGNVLGDLSSSYGMAEYQKVVLDEGDGSEKIGGLVKNVSMSNSSSPSSANSNGYTFRAENCHQPAAATEEDHSLINVISGYDHFMHANASSLVSFEQSDGRISLNNNNSNYLKVDNHKDDYSMWKWNHLNHSNRWNQINPKYNSDPRLVEDFHCFDTAGNCGFTINNSNTAKENHGDWIYSEATAVTDSTLESGSQDAGSLKRTNKGESMQALKKQCSSTSIKKPDKLKTVRSSKDPQSIAAKNRRERISERLKILQELVPNGSKFDLVTMLEKAISYVKFLQLQVKVLATDEFWPVQGGKAPDICQVREAIDAILSSHSDRNSNSK